MKQLLPFIFLLTAPTWLKAQQLLELDACIRHALQYEQHESQSMLQWRQQQTDLHFHKWSLLPDLNGFTSFNTYFGRRVDPYTNTFATNTVNSNSYGLNSSVTLFRGLYYFSERKRLLTAIANSNLSIEQQRNQRLRRIIELYALLAVTEQEKQLSAQRIGLYEKIQELQRKLIAAGKISTADTLKSRNALYQEQLTREKLGSDLRIHSIELNFLAGFDLETEHSYTTASIGHLTHIPRSDGQLALLQLETERELSGHRMLNMRSESLPSLSLSGSMGTGFSTNNKDYSVPDTPVKPFADQLSQNLYQGLSFNLSVPIFNKGTLAKARSREQLVQEELEDRSQLLELQLKQQKLQAEQRVVFLAANRTTQEEMAAALRIVYEKSLLLYEEGRITFSELQQTLIDWKNMEFTVIRTSVEHQKALLQLYAL